MSRTDSGNDQDRGLSRWSRRKAESRTAKRGRARPVAVHDPGEAKPDPLAGLEEAPTDAGGENVDIESPGEPAGETSRPGGDPDSDGDPEVIANLPDIETMDGESDFSQFMQKGVPEALKRMALRKLWLSGGIFAELDGMNEYDEDYRKIDGLLSLADTNYQVGKGLVTASEEQSETENEGEIVAADNAGNADVAGDAGAPEPPETAAAADIGEPEEENEDDRELG